MTTVRVRVPEELARAIEGIDGVTPAAARRSSWQIAVDVLTSATAVITLLQAPQTLADVSSRIHRLFTDSRRDNESITIEMIGPGGQVRIEFTEDTDIGDIERLSRGTFFDDEND